MEKGEYKEIVREEIEREADAFASSFFFVGIIIGIIKCFF